MWHWALHIISRLRDIMNMRFIASCSPAWWNLRPDNENFITPLHSGDFLCSFLPTSGATHAATGEVPGLAGGSGGAVGGAPLVNRRNKADMDDPVSSNLGHTKN